MAEPQTPTTLVDWLDDLSVRFLLNLPKSELSSVPRLCFQVEEAQWFYEDFVRPAVAASGAQPLPSLPLRQFCLMLFQHCPLLSGYNDAQHIAAYEEFLAYKVRVPVRGAILLDESMENVVLVRGWKKGSSWSFPRGKINKDEKDLDCAVREVYEETGYDVRQAGLMPDQEKDAKYIDIVMREQHMRLFVFRGVPEDTHFEPKTRKEISKIQWYSIKDLPGFKKQKHSQAGDASNASKFYMVAPFLGQLKKWINLQRKKDASQPKHTRVTSDGLGIQTATEDEGETEEATEATPEPAPLPDKRSEDLKRLLSTGGGNAVPAQPPAPQQENQKNDLLAMLRGGAQPGNGNRPPQTPFEQVDTVPKEPETPQPDHMRQPMIPPQQQPPHYPLSPPRMQQEQQRNYSLPTPQIFGPAPHAGGFPPPQHQNGFPGMVPPHIQQQQQQFQQRQSVPNMPFVHQENMPLNGPPGRQQMPPPQLPPQQQHPLQPPPPQQAPNAYMVQGPQGAIASGPAAPNPSQLPAPRLNAHHINLLNAFKSGNKPPAAPVAPGQPTSRHGSTHQAALLDLFRKPSTSQTPPAEPAPEPTAPVEAVSPTLTDVTEKPPPKKKQERKPTLNEITRTLPTKMKVKSPPPATGAASPPARPASGQLFDPNAAKSTSASSGQTPQKQQPPVAVLQRPPSGQGQQQQTPQRQPQSAQAKPSSSPAQDTQTRQKQNGAPPAPFTILARPSSRGLKSPAPVAPPSPLRNQTPQSPASSSPFQPQVLKRPKGGDGDALLAAAAVREGERSQQQSVSATGQAEGQKDHLLALFGKASAGASSSTSLQSPPPAPATAPSPSPTPQSQGQAQANTQRNALLDLLKSPSPSTTSSQQQQKPPTPAAPSPSLEPPLPPNPPSAPRLSPSRNPSSSANPHTQAPSQGQGGKIHPIRQPVQPPTNHHQPQHSSSHSRGGGGQQQNLLLDIFTRPSSSASGAGGHKRTATPELRSPGTPISPFTLGTPAQTGFGDRGARGGSIASASASSGEGAGRRGSAIGGTGAPTDASAREFLMGFLNGVARGEGQGQGQK